MSSATATSVLANVNEGTLLLQSDFPVDDLSDILEEVDSQPFARGGYSFVYKYRPRRRSEANITTASDKLFAVKVLKHLLDDPNLERLNRKLRREINAWILLKHPNVLEFHGVVSRTDSPMPCLVSDFLENGTSSAFIRRTPEANLIRFLRGMADGLSYLHSQNIVHADLKADNVFVNRSGEACIGDLGLSRILKFDGSATATTSDGNRASRWTAVEYVDFANGPETPTMKGDVWSFGCTVLELLSGKLPYFDIKTEILVVISLSQGDLPKFSPYGSLLRNDFEKYREGIRALCSLCWIKDPVCRPDMDTIASVINSFCLEGGSCGVATSVNTDSNAASNQSASNIAYTSAESDDIGIALSRTLVLRRNNVSRSSSSSTITPGDISGRITSSENNEEQVVIGNFQSPISPSPSFVENRRTSVNSPTQQVGEIEETLSNSTPWSTVPPPPEPSIESMLAILHKSAQAALNEYFQVQGDWADLLYRSEPPTGPSHNQTHCVICLIQGQEYGTGSSRTMKKSKELASLRALERLYQEDPSRFPRLRYLPVLRTHLEDYTGFEWSSHSAPQLNDQNEWVHTVTLKLNEVVLGIGHGPTRDEAREQAARDAANVWRRGVSASAEST